MLHITFQVHRLFDSRLFHVFTIYGHDEHLGHVTWTIWTNFRSPITMEDSHEIRLQLAISQEKKFQNIESEWPWSKVNELPWILIFTTFHVLIYLTASTNFDITDYNGFWNVHCFTFSPYKSIRDQIWPCRKIGPVQPRVIIWTNLVVLEYPMLHFEFQGHWPFGSGEDF